MTLKEFLFGKEIVLLDDFFGQIESSKTRSKTAKSLSWFFKFNISDFKRETEIITEGNYLGINYDSKNTLINFILNFDDFYSQKVNDLISINLKIDNLKTWQDNYYISVIHPSLTDLSPSNFEIFFQAYENKNRLFMIKLINNKLTNLEICGNVS